MKPIGPPSGDRQKQVDLRRGKNAHNIHAPHSSIPPPILSLLLILSKTPHLPTSESAPTTNYQLQTTAAPDTTIAPLAPPPLSHPSSPLNKCPATSSSPSTSPTASKPLPSSASSEAPSAGSK